ncbi:MAG: flagellar basal body-associated FliL family protein [Deltaproteobacteria bacterium]|nr:flagellar basal body-associated FliL family protein [Deltaproteobacteria bacterium]
MKSRHFGFSPTAVFHITGRVMPMCLMIMILVGFGCLGKTTVGSADIGEDRDVRSGTEDLISGKARQEHIHVQKVTLPQASFEYFKEFIIYVKDDTSSGVLVCNVVLELRPGTKLTQDRFELRKIIYRISKELRIHFSSLLNARERLKKEIKEKLNRFMGNDVITDVYITKFILL